jgi:hypothetical protein
MIHYTGYYRFYCAMVDKYTELLEQSTTAQQREIRRQSLEYYQTKLNEL